MKKILTYIRRLFWLIVFLFTWSGAYANHLVGMDFYYTWVSGNTYKITLIAYGNCGSAGAGSAYNALPTSSPEVYIFNGDAAVGSIALTIQPPSAGVDITPVCPADSLLTQCTSTSYTIPGIKEFVYTGEYTVSGPSAYWRFVFTGNLCCSYEAGRATSITNLTGGITDIQLTDTLNNMTGPNSSPDLSVIPTPFFCLDNDDNYNPGAIPADGDSLVFSLVPGMAGTDGSSVSTTPVTYATGYSATTPLSASSFAFDPATGQISFYPTSTQRSLVVYNIEQYRDGVLVGTSQREMTFLVLTCSTSAPSGGFTDATNGTIDDSTHFHICENSGPFSIDINPSEADTANTITVSYSGLPTGATMAITANGTNHPHSVFSWTSTAITPGSYTFYVTFKDNNCPEAGVETYAYTINILPQPILVVSLVTAGNCFAKEIFSINPSGDGAPWTIKVSAGAGDTIQTYTSVTRAFRDSLGPGTYTVTVSSTITGSCSTYALLTIADPTPVVPRISFTNPSYCGDINGTITLLGLDPGTTDTIKYTFNGVSQPPQLLTVAVDSTVVISGLPAGVYNDITVTYGRYCVSSPVGPVTLVNPPFTMRALTFTDPLFCGICNGTITLYGLRPGQTDTINYTIGGIAATPVISVIPTDSEVMLTGLCTGTYDNFVANTAEDCVSNVLGPADLAVPPFTMHGPTSTNPSYCGVCDGTITLYGLHPGQTDTITYTLDGAAQPPISVLIPTDSEVTLTGLCVGTYDNFVATTAISCVTNTVGPVTLTAPPFTMRAITSTNPSYCGVCNGTITLYGLHPGETDTITYTMWGVAQTPVPVVVPADSMVTLTGLCAGEYENFIAKTAGVCVSNSLGPVTLTVPPFTMRSISFTNPSYCGQCNGTITLYGLHPGETDTINYTYNGVAQPPVMVTVPADSMVTISSLCAGVYANFIAKTGGDCVSNTLGPVTLTVPPFTVRALSSVNPVYCGICNGSITLLGVHPGETDTINYSFGGLAQTPITVVIPADSMVTISGLCAGTYSGFVVNTGGDCISNTLGPVTLTTPPFTMSGITFTNPTKCGFCNGTITLHGLYPGQTDTLNYTLAGVSQPPVAVTITADSEILLTGMCEGTYANFIAHTAGSCISNTLGPVALVAPPITDSFIVADIIQSCKADTVMLTNYSAPPADLYYTWYYGDGTSDTVTNPSHVYYSSGTFTIKLMITNTKCIDSSFQTITLGNLINAGFTADPDSFLCQGKPVTFTNTSSGGSTALNYNWYFGDGYTSTTTSPVHVYLDAGLYNAILVVSNYVPCYDTVEKTLQVDSMSAISFSMTDSVFCRGTESTFTGVYSLYGNTGLVWKFGDGDSVANTNPVSHSFDIPGQYKVTITALYRACPDTSASHDVNVFSAPSINIGADTSICPGSDPIWPEDVINESNPQARWLWSTGQTTSKIMVTAPGDYVVTVKIDGCEASDTLSVSNSCYLDIPNVFTPNGDGLNDYFLPRNLLAKGLATFKMDIYNRWGELIFETTNTDGRGWDGRFNNTPQPEGVFVYVIDATFIDGEKEHHTGNVTLLR